MILKKIKNYIRQNFKCKHNWHFLMSQYKGIMIIGTNDRIEKAECVYCGKVIKKERKLLKLLMKEGIL